ncbi:VOC family protein [Frankia sp. CNm7]|uniref:VOC family protein n=1 Tax=Frankia nepalensis TaxID=1836974 RepID=A0A937RIQ3_9ACTN|nr:VOC family protein [Frankia nepalensis]MBL7501910.1 VOC family protein [Frankia nepalensis]MBL7513915.1 VOC family protein [Frankia nepalensis]MBL7521322.1 VOC family protein [Frankia nepalensis]MBL7629569.1 VOC family protein [Frankia nepalensis]
MLADAELIAFVPTVDLDRALSFYQGVLGLQLLEETPAAAVFQVDGTMLRISAVPEIIPQPFTTLGWRVDDITVAVRWLTDRGVRVNHYDGLDQDDLGIWTTPGRDRIAWFTDPDGNTLSVTEFAPLAR